MGSVKKVVLGCESQHFCFTVRGKGVFENAVSLKLYLVKIHFHLEETFFLSQTEEEAYA